jgi:phage repressor protein C with HTH and peptisase S24 domain
MGEAAAEPPMAPKSLGNPAEPRGLRRFSEPAEILEPGAGLQDRIRMVIALYKTQKEAAKAAGRTPESLQNWMKGNAAPPFDVMVNLALDKGVRLDWLATGIGQMKGESSSGGAEGYVYIPRYDVRVGAGNGQIVDTTNLKGFLAFREDWVRSRLRRNPAYLAVMEAFGDSMHPTIKDGDIMLVDLSENTVRGPAVYAVVAGEAAIVKRIELKIDGSLLVKSDNPAYEPIELKGPAISDLRVIGKVVWSGGLI